MELDSETEREPAYDVEGFTKEWSRNTEDPR